MSPSMRQKLGRVVDSFGMLAPLLVRRLPGPLDHIDDLESPEAQDTLRRLVSQQFEIVDGHHRFDAAIASGATEVPIVVVDCDHETAVLLALEMNRLHGELDLSLVAANFQELEVAGMSREDMTLSAFDPDEIAALLASLSSTDQSNEVMEGGAGQNEDETPEQPAKPFELVLGFRSAKTLKAIKRVLSKHAGGGKRPDLPLGMLRLCGVDEEPPS